MENKIISVVLGYRRPGNVKAVIEAIKSQTIKSTIIFFDNGDCGNVDADIVIKSSFNFNCLPRFFIPCWLPCEYVWQNDDDHFIGNNNFFERMLAESADYPEYALCYNGRVLAQEKAYQAGSEVTEPIKCQVCNFGFSFYPQSLMQNIPALQYDGKVSFEEMKYSDDVWMSYHMPCRVSKNIRGSLVKLSEGDEAITLSKSSNHMNARNTVAKRLFQ